MKIAIIGTGRMGKALLKVFYAAYPADVVIAGRDLHHTQEIVKELGVNATAVSEEDALQADLIIPTLWFADLLPWAKKHEAQLKGKILIDITNPFNETFDDFTIGYGTSSAEELQKIIPGTIVVGAFKNTYWVVFDTPVWAGIKSDVYVTSNNAEAVQKVMRLLTPLPFRIFDAGKLQNNRTIERMTLLERELAIKAGNHPRVSFHLWGTDK